MYSYAIITQFCHVLFKLSVAINNLNLKKWTDITSSKDPLEYLQMESVSNFHAYPTKEMEIAKIIKNLKVTHSGIDQMSSDIVKASGETIANPLSVIMLE